MTTKSSSPAAGRQSAVSSNKLPAAPRRARGDARAAAAASYADVVEFLASRESQRGGGVDLRQAVPASALAQLQRKHAGLPLDYVDYLREVGWGSFLRCRYTVYQRLMPAADRFGNSIAERLGQRVLCFGDNMAGDVAGFLPDRDWTLIEIDPLEFAVHETGQSFGRYIRERMGLDPADA